MYEVKMKGAAWRELATPAPAAANPCCVLHAYCTMYRYSAHTLRLETPLHPRSAGEEVCCLPGAGGQQGR